MLMIRPRHVLRSTISIVAGITILLLSILFAPAVSARSTQHMVNGPTILKASIGFDGIYQDGNWTPIQIDLSNSGNDFTGKISINVPSAAIPGPNMMQRANAYQETINLPPGAKKQVTLSVPVDLSFQGANAQISVDLLDEAGHRVAHQAILSGNNNNNLTLIGILSDTPNNFGQLNLSLSNLFSTSGQIKNLSAATLPKQAQVLKNFDAIVLDNFTTSSLSQDQLGALQSWVNQGGNLIVSGGPEWKRTLSSLPGSLLPVTIQGNGTLAAGKHLLPVNTLTKGDQPAKDTVNATVPISLAQTTPNSTTILADGKTPLIAQKTLGQGTVYYLAYDPTLEPLTSWQQTNQLWSSVLLRSLSDRVLTSANNTNINKGQMQSGMNYFPGMTALLQTFFPNAYPSIWLILVLLLSYVAILGPIRLLLVRVLKRRSWTWRIVLSTIVVFTLLSYGLALQQKGSSIINSSITLLQLNAPDKTGSSGHATTWLGVFVPSQGDFQVHVPGTTLVQPVEQVNPMYSPYSQSSGTQNSIFTVGNNNTDVNLQGVDIWTTRSLLTQQDTHTTGGITSQLQVQNNTVSGTVTSTLPYTLADAFVLVGNSYVAIGDLQSNSTKQITINLTSKSSPSANNLTIADQIANSRGLTSSPNDGYYASNGSSQPRDTPIAMR
ncbi:DUF7408 domain-containing protein [Dictyobacter vulcani]|nr:hypothetical protein [Dictyobacter vulcani]